MKRFGLCIAICLGLSVLTLSCRDTKRESETSTSHNHDADELAILDAYACPMNCEQGKTYVEESTCPVCRMVLQKVEDAEGDTLHQKNHIEAEHHAHDKDTVHGED